MLSFIMSSAGQKFWYLVLSIICKNLCYYNHLCIIFIHTTLISSVVMMIVSKSKSQFEKKIVGDRKHNIFPVRTIFSTISMLFTSSI